MRATPGSDPQRGVALVVGMAMLVILTLVVLSAVSLSTGNIKATSNMQFRDAALAAANLAIEQVVSSPITGILTSTAIEVDIDQDTVRDYLITVEVPTCLSWRSVSNLQLDVSNPEDVKCFSGTGAGSRLGGGGGTTTSLCADTTWAIRAPVGDQDTGASVTVNQGIGQRVERTIAETACNGLGP